MLRAIGTLSVVVRLLQGCALALTVWVLLAGPPALVRRGFELASANPWLALVGSAHHWSDQSADQVVFGSAWLLTCAYFALALVIALGLQWRRCSEIVPLERLTFLRLRTEVVKRAFLLSPEWALLFGSAGQRIGRGEVPRPSATSGPLADVRIGEVMVSNRAGREGLRDCIGMALVSAAFAALCLWTLFGSSFRAVLAPEGYPVVEFLVLSWLSCFWAFMAGLAMACMLIKLASA